MYYLDNAATTRIHDEVVSVINKYSSDFYFNPSSVYAPAVSVRKDIEKVRKEILDNVCASDHNLVFLSSATEANNLIFNSVNLRSGDKVLISSSEHPSVFVTVSKLKEKGVIVDLIKNKSNGQIDVDDLKSKLDNNVKLVSVMFVCNETGAIHDLKAVSKIVKGFNKNILLASDCVQAYGKIDICIDEIGIDFFVISAHKIHGPKGIGALGYKKSLNIKPLIYGGGQEMNLRSGTENVTGIMALGKASEIAFDNIDKNYKKVAAYKNKLISDLSKIKNITFNAVENSSPYILSLSIEGLRGEVLLHELEKYNIFISTGSACSSKNFDNRILESYGLNIDQIKGSVRISFNAYDDYDIDYIAEKLKLAIIDLKGRIL